MPAYPEVSGPARTGTSAVSSSTVSRLSGRPRKFVGVHQAAAVATRVPWRDEWETSSVPRRTWLDQKGDALLEELAASGMDLDRQRAGELITDRVHAVAALMRVTAPTARRYLDDETVRDMARRMLFEFAAEQPGADLLEVPRTVPVPLVFVGIIVAALAEAMQVRAANEPSDRLGRVVATYGQMLSGLGQVTAAAVSSHPRPSTIAHLPPPPLP